MLWRNVKYQLSYYHLNHVIYQEYKAKAPVRGHCLSLHKWCEQASWGTGGWRPDSGWVSGGRAWLSRCTIGVDKPAFAQIRAHNLAGGKGAQRRSCLLTGPNAYSGRVEVGRPYGRAEPSKRRVLSGAHVPLPPPEEAAHSCFGMGYPGNCPGVVYSYRQLSQPGMKCQGKVTGGKRLGLR